ncbi:hypothetical protein LCGC14_2978270 [marine sediment metagenome]|uniref:Uncharacterized protein n=1 Tax=marine sediment metagenome TaxID=412755 RepID=A0A0F8ZEX3_9ZZZZ
MVIRTAIVNMSSNWANTASDIIGNSDAYTPIWTDWKLAETNLEWLDRRILEIRDSWKGR